MLVLALYNGHCSELNFLPHDTVLTTFIPLLEVTNRNIKVPVTENKLFSC
jgi:hypothetical protein